MRIERLLGYDLKTIKNVCDRSLTLRFAYIAIGEGQVEIFRHRKIVDQVILLENEPNIFFVQLSALPSIELMHGVIVKVVSAIPSTVEHANDRKERRFSGS